MRFQSGQVHLICHSIQCNVVTSPDTTLSFESSYGCPKFESATDCDIFELQCYNSHRIQIGKAKYANQLPLNNHEFSTDNELIPPRDDNPDYNSYSDRLEQRRKCNAEVLRQCNESDFSAVKTHQEYNLYQRYALLEKCSWKTHCQPPAIRSGMSHAISFRCIPGTMFCVTIYCLYIEIYNFVQYLQSFMKD